MAMHRAGGSARARLSPATLIGQVLTTMAINMPAFWENSVPKALFDIIKLEGGQGKLPVSIPLMGGCLAAAAVFAALEHGLSHSPLGSVAFGGGVAVLLAGGTAGVLKLYKTQDKTVQTITALAAVMGFIALVSILLHFVFATALPPPLPSDRLIRFLLFPIIIWKVFAFAYLYKHAGIRTIPALAFSATLAIVIDFIMATLLH
jgi:hypothetical protein